MRLALFSSKQCIIKQLLDSVFVISGIIKGSGSVISLSLRLRLITLTSTLIIPDITKTSSNNCLLWCSARARFARARSSATNLKFLSLLPSIDGYVFLDFYVLLCNTCLYRSVHSHGHHCHSSPLAKVRNPRRAAAGALVLVINKGTGQFYLSFDTR